MQDPMDDGLDLLRDRPEPARKRGLTVDRVVIAASSIGYLHWYVVYVILICVCHTRWKLKG